MTNARAISTNQSGIHEHLESLVKKHLDHQYLKPIQPHNIDAYRSARDRIDTWVGPLILDSCCGTGMSSLNIANTHPEHLVIGVDRSAHRLSKTGEKPPDNLLYIQANCEDIWRLCDRDDLQFDKHFILYPNPYPKSKHIQLRWHGHPVFPVLARLSKSLEIRSNWRLYVEEFKQAWQWMTGAEIAIEPIAREEARYTPITLFEKKYAEADQTLYRWCATLISDG